MRKQSILVFAFSFISYLSFSQIGEWVWLRGDSTKNSVGNFGTQGVPSPLNVPDALYEGCEWVDLNGNFWMFGGQGNLGEMADLWKYNPVTNEWTWVKGPGTITYAGSYGVQGVSSPTNNPPYKIYGPTSWVDTLGNLWMFGGSGGSSDLWKYNISINEWTWMKGPKSGPGIYGTQGVPDTANYPMSRYECATSWVDSNGDLWLFGGLTKKIGTATLNDLWRYQISTNTWTWMHGSSLGGQPGIYGTQGVEAPSNTPGHRAAYSKWKDKNGNFWLFGGWRYGPSDSLLNDLWRYNPVTNSWAWMHGSNLANQPGNYGTKCVTTASNTPGERFESRAVWHDQNGDFWMFGGMSGAGGNITLNDLWKYCVSGNKWTWESGDSIPNTPGSFGIMGVSSPSNLPIGRGGSLPWTDGNGHLYFFGGWNFYNDLWKFTIDPGCGSCLSRPVVVFTSSDTAFCSEGGKCIDFTDLSTQNPTKWKWLFPGAIPDTSDQQNPVNICYYTPGTYAVTLIATNAGGSDTATNPSMIIFASGATAPVIYVSNDTIFSSHAVSYQWYFNGLPIAGATDSFYVFTQGGNYNVYITDGFGCSRLGNALNVSVQESSFVEGIRIYPNPVRQELAVTGEGLWRIGQVITVEVNNVLGERLYFNQLKTQNPRIEMKIDVSEFANGVYLIQVSRDDKLVRKRFLKN